MTIEQLRRVAKNLAVVLRRELASVEAIEARAGDAIDPQADDRYAGEELVDVEAHAGGRVVVGYRRRTGQAPILIVLRPPDRWKLMLTAERALEGYAAFDEGEDGDLMQDRALEGPLEVVLRELDRLAALADAPPPAVAAGKVRETARDFELVCSVCGARASRFQKGLRPGDDHLVYFNGEGVQRWMFPGSTSEGMAALLAKGDLAGLVAFMDAECTFKATIDTYAPDRDVVLCRAHAGKPGA